MLTLDGFTAQRGDVRIAFYVRRIACILQHLEQEYATHLPPDAMCSHTHAESVDPQSDEKEGAVEYISFAELSAPRNHTMTYHESRILEEIEALASVFVLEATNTTISRDEGSTSCWSFFPCDVKSLALAAGLEAWLEHLPDRHVHALGSVLLLPLATPEGIATQGVASTLDASSPTHGAGQVWSDVGLADEPDPTRRLNKVLGALRANTETADGNQQGGSSPPAMLSHAVRHSTARSLVIRWLCELCFPESASVSIQQEKEEKEMEDQMDREQNGSNMNDEPASSHQEETQPSAQETAAGTPTLLDELGTLLLNHTAVGMATLFALPDRLQRPVERPRRRPNSGEPSSSTAREEQIAPASASSPDNSVCIHRSPSPLEAVIPLLPLDELRERRPPIAKGITRMELRSYYYETELVQYCRLHAIATSTRLVRMRKEAIISLIIRSHSEKGAQKLQNEQQKALLRTRKRKRARRE